MRFDLKLPQYLGEMKLEFRHQSVPQTLTLMTMGFKGDAIFETWALAPESRYSTQLFSTHEMELVIEWRPRTPLPTEKKVGEK